MISQILVDHSGEELPRQVDGEVSITKMAIAPINGTFETTGTGERVTKLDIINYRHVDLLLKANLIKHLAILLRYISDAHVLSLSRFF